MQALIYYKLKFLYKSAQYNSKQHKIVDTNIEIRPFLCYNIPYIFTQKRLK